jgi:N6-L-threonylcarbamoyladenine synthase
LQIEKLGGAQNLTNSQKCDIAASFQKAITKHLLQKSKKIFKNNPIKNFAIVGGVSANRYINKSFKNLCKEFNKNFVEVELKYSADNAAMIGRWAIEAYKNKSFSNLDDIIVQASKKCTAGSFL